MHGRTVWYWMGKLEDSDTYRYKEMSEEADSIKLLKEIRAYNINISGERIKVC
jgi:hypothetical protein